MPVRLECVGVVFSIGILWEAFTQRSYITLYEQLPDCKAFLLLVDAHGIG